MGEGLAVGRGAIRRGVLPLLFAASVAGIAPASVAAQDSDRQRSVTVSSVLRDFKTPAR